MMKLCKAFPVFFVACFAALSISCGDAYYDVIHGMRSDLVLGPAPVVTGITPNTGLDPNLVPGVVITGSGFSSGATVRLVRSGYPDIAASNVTVVSDTEIHCDIILPWAMYGPWSVAVANPFSYTGYLADGFEVTWPDPTVTSITPNSGSEPNTIFVTNLAGTHFMSGAAVQLRQGGDTIDATGEFTVSPFQITCAIPLAGAVHGPWAVEVTNPVGGSGTLLNAFTVGWGAPTVTGISPAACNDPGTHIVTVYGTNFKSLPAVPTVRFVQGVDTITATGVAFVSAGELSCSFTFSGAMYGPWTVEVINADSQSASLANCLTVNWPAVTVTGITPNSGNEGYSVVITDLEGTHFAGTPTVELHRGVDTISATGVSVVSQNQIQCSFDLTDAERGTWDVVVTNTVPTYSVTASPGTLAGAFTVGWDAPTVTSITPATGLEPGPYNDVTITGTGFRPGMTIQLTQAPYTAIGVSDVKFVSDTQATCDLDLLDRWFGQWDVVVTNVDAQSASKADCYTVTWPAPTLTSITPASGVKGQVVSITNLAGTKFKNGAGVRLVKSPEPDIIADSVTVTSATQITCSINLAGAATGTWDVVVNNADGGLDTLPGAFTVTTVGLIYDGNGNTAGTAPTDSTAYGYGDTVTVTGNFGGLEKSGSFKEWNTLPGGGGDRYNMGETFTMGSTDVKLYAIYHTAYYKLRDVGPAGGLIFYVASDYSKGWRYLEAAPADVGPGVYGCEGAVFGATATAPGEGLGNTNIIVAKCGEPNLLAQSCLDYENNTYTDWYMPTGNGNYDLASSYASEMHLIYHNLHEHGVGNMQKVSYYSSTEMWTVNASIFAYDLEPPNNYIGGKTLSLWARPVRRF
ncbi:MAG: IPT/TIG domain-containing protein [Spirochaetes bacterium]|nr:IPT/TIG domain-containing protein [Spirochaetota bacterium]